MTRVWLPLSRKVLLAPRRRALVRSSLTAPPMTMMRPQGFAWGKWNQSMSSNALANSSAPAVPAM